MAATEPATIHTTSVIEHNYPQPPANVYAAFAQPARKRRWYAEGDHEIQEFEMDFRVGGTERLSYRFKSGHPIEGQQIVNQTRYQDIVPDKRIVVANVMSLNGKPILAAQVTFEFLPAGSGTDLICTSQGAFFDWPQGPMMIEAGWRALLDRVGQELASKPA
jgi:uncharacterized protein YndB with AHSA1/START domain